MITDNRTNEPTEAQVEAAVHGAWVKSREFRGAGGQAEFAPPWEFQQVIRAALVAAQGAAPVLSSSGVGEDALVQVLEAHRYKGMGWCECGENVNVRDGHRRHVARAVVAYLRGES